MKLLRRLAAAVTAVLMVAAPLLTADIRADGSASAAPSDFIVIDQFGYRPSAQKVAVVRNPKRGADAELSFAPDTSAGGYKVVNAADNSTAVFQGTLVHKFDDDPASGDEIWWFDFSAVTAPGRYYILDTANNVRSFPFSIAEDVYNEPLKHAVRMFYYQRAGFEKEARYAGADWADGASHIKPGQDTQARDFFAQNDPTTERDVSGGWYDAGDYNKYTPWTARYIEEMLNTYRENPKVFGDDYNIPESGNGIPDIIDEARWGMEHLLKLQKPDGSVISVVGLSHASPPSSASGRSYYGRPNTTSAYAAARAYALGAVVFEEWFGAGYAERLKTAAGKAWAWAEANPDVFFFNNQNRPEDGYDATGLASGSQEIADDSTGARTENRLWAALYMYELTGEKPYLAIFDANYTNLPLYQWWGFMDHYRTSQHLLYFQYMSYPAAAPSVVAELKNGERGGLLAGFNKPGDYAGKLGEDGYRSFTSDYPWGSNRAKSEVGYTFYYWAERGLDPANAVRNKDAAEDYLHYIHGVNPFNWVYLTNMNAYGASRSLTDVYHEWFGNWTNVAPPPGYVPGGANQGFGVESRLYGYSPTPEEIELRDYIQNTLAGSPPAKMYMDIGHGWPINTWEISEPSGSYQAAYIRLLSKFASAAVLSYGDLNGDGKVSSVDVTYMRRALAGWGVYRHYLPLCHVSGRGTAEPPDAYDITYLRRHVAGWAGYRELGP